MSKRYGALSAMASAKSHMSPKSESATAKNLKKTPRTVEKGKPC